MDNSPSYPLARAVIITAPYPKPEPMVGFRATVLRYNARRAAFSVGVDNEITLYQLRRLPFLVINGLRGYAIIRVGADILPYTFF